MRGDDSRHFAELMTYAISGMVLGAGTLLFCALVGAFLLAIAQNATGVTDSGAAMDGWIPVATAVIAVLLSTAFGIWMYRLRRRIGNSEDASHAQLVRRRRRYFTFGAMLVYVPLSPALWLFFVAAVNSGS